MNGRQAENEEGHAIHFLKRLPRASGAASELALELYHNPDIVRYLIQHAPLPAEEERIAISLDEKDQGPYLIVASKNGRFITCLGDGMSIGDTYLFNYSRLCAYIKKSEKFRQTLDLLYSPRTEKLLRRIKVSGATLSREEMRILADTQPALKNTFVEAWFRYVLGAKDLGRKLSISKHLGSEKLRGDLKTQWDYLWACGHCSLLMSLDGPSGMDPLFNGPHLDNMVPVLSSPSVTGFTPVIIRALWAIGRFGKAILPSCKHAALSPISAEDWILGVVGMTIIGIRHGKYRAEIEKTIKQIVKAGSSLPFTAFKLWHDAGFERVLTGMYLALEDPNTVLDAFKKTAHAMMFDCWQQHPSPEIRRWQTPEDIPDDIALAGCANLGGSLYDHPEFLNVLLLMAPWLARCTAEELYYPKAVLDALDGRWEPENTIILVEGEHKKWGGRIQTVVAPKTPGRNDPCSCGSNKKYKKCCMGKANAEPERESEPAD